ncbi:hypothetical protein Scep_011631 [Stephania cephalantha]|uniref:Bulb-type lectin domain-containing protein n=1 Tax=Stephania cephalantha TaxID=152367 RepID=A0AAP0JDR2_9MAGN
MSNLLTPSLIFTTLLIFLSITTLTQSIVPPSKTFRVINSGPLDDFGPEYRGTTYRYSTLNLKSFPFSLCFYNTTNNAFTLGLLMGSVDNESILRFVWDANRRRPVRENAALTFARDGNLVLRDVDGRIAWQTNTANKGVVGLKLLPNGNLVLYNSKNRYVWQSFNYPTDTLLVGQSLRPNGPNKLIARRSTRDQSDGLYSYVLQGTKLTLYYHTKNSPKPLSYYSQDIIGPPLSQVLFTSTLQENKTDTYELKYDFFVNNSQVSSGVLAPQIMYDTTLSMHRLDYDGNLRIYTYNDKIDTHAWEVTYSAFGERGVFDACDLPSTCGALGVCDANRCVGCPTEKGLVPWREGCKPPKLPPCRVGGANDVEYYKVVGVEHSFILDAYGDRNTTMEECREMCSKDCGCLGFFYWEDFPTCYLAPELGTLRRARNKAHVGYIKKAKK